MRKIWLILLLGVLAGCGISTDPEREQKAQTPELFSDQIKALEKAKQVNNIVNQAAKDQQRQIETQSYPDP